MKDLMCWFNGEVMPLDNVSISVLDFGFIHSDATYDVFRITDGKMKFYDEHLKRFEESCQYYGFSVPKDINKIMLELIEKNGEASDYFAWMCVWRGAPPSGSPRDLNGPQNTLCYIKPYYSLGKDDSFSLMIDRDHRRVPDLSYGQQFKNFSWIELTLAQRAADQNGFDSGLVLSVDGYISEGPGFGICFVKNGEVITPKRDCLQSVTVSIVEKICCEQGIPFLRKDITLEEAYSSEEAFACSTSGGITPVSRIDDSRYESVVTRLIKKCYKKL